MARYPDVIFERGRHAPRFTVSALEYRVRKALARAREARIRLSNAMATVRPLASSGAKMVVVEDLKYEGGHLAKWGNYYLFRMGGSARFTASYRVNTPFPVNVKALLSVDGTEKSKIVRHVGRGRGFRLSVDYRVRSPTTARALASIEVVMRPVLGIVLRRLLRGRGSMLYDSLRKSYAFGLLDDSPKPLSEYPVEGAQNEELDMPATWEVKDYVYPNPPGVISVDPVSKEFTGVVRVAGSVYRVPTEIVRVRMKWRVMYTGSGTVRVVPFFGVVSVLYEDLKHVSQVTVDMSGVPTVDLSGSQSREFELEVGIPEWAYGHIAVGLAQAYLLGGRLIYLGGPVYQFDLGRMLLPVP